MMSEELILFRKMQHGDASALEIFFQRYTELLYYRALGIVRDSSVAEDIVQEVFIRFWDSRDKLVISSSVPAYLTRSVVNACHDYLDHVAVEKRYAEKYRQEFKEEILPDWDAEEIELLRQKLNEFVQTLPDKCREIFVMACIEGVKYREVAEKLDVSVNTVKSQVKNAYIKLRTKFGLDDKGFVLFLLVVMNRSVDKF